VAGLRRDHQEDFEKALLQRNRSVDEFAISVTPEQIVPAGAVAGPLTSTVTITEQSSKISRTYTIQNSVTYGPAGEPVPWVKEFLRELDGGVFK